MTLLKSSIEVILLRLKTRRRWTHIRRETRETQSRYLCQQVRSCIHPLTTGTTSRHPGILNREPRTNPGESRQICRKTRRRRTRSPTGQASWWIRGTSSRMTMLMAVCREEVAVFATLQLHRKRPWTILRIVGNCRDSIASYRRSTPRGSQDMFALECQEQRLKKGMKLPK